MWGVNRQKKHPLSRIVAVYVGTRIQPLDEYTDFRNTLIVRTAVFTVCPEPGAGRQGFSR